LTLLAAIAIHSVAFVGAFLVLNGIAQFSIAKRLWVRTISGATGGVTSVWYLSGVAPFLSYVEAAAAGDLGAGGLFFILSFIALLSVWAFNLYKTERVILQ